MAEAPDYSPRKRSESYEFLPPHMSELNVVLLGNSFSLKNYVGNLLLMKPVLNTETEAQTIQTYEGKMNDQRLTVVMTPDLQHINRAEFTGYMKTLSGPHVFLLVLQPEDFTEKHKDKLQLLLLSCSEKAFDQSLVLISTTQSEKPGIMKKLMSRVPYVWSDDPRIQNMIIECKSRYLCINNKDDDLKKRELKREELFTRISQMLKENCEPSLAVSVKKKSCLNLVLCGRAGAEKSSVLESITGQSSERLSLDQCEKLQVEVCGRWVSVLELPPLSGSDKPVEEVMEQCLHCLSLCGPQGIQAFILVLPLGSLSDEDKSELKTLQDMFSSAVRPFTIFLFTVDSDQTVPALVDKDLLELCGGGHLIFNTRGQQQVSELLDFVETLKAQNKPQSFTTETLIHGQRTMISQLREIQDLKDKRTDNGSEASADGLRIALMGKTGCGKSSSANTILGREEFEAEMSSLSVTVSCAKAEAEVDGRRVAVVDTPGLFDSTMSNDQVIEEMTKCISFLAPGPHVFLLVLQIGRFTPEEKEAIKVITQSFGKESQKYTMILFTRGDELKKCSIADFIKKGDSSLKKLLSDCGNRYHVFNNNIDLTDKSQVKELIKKIDLMVKENGGGCYTNDMFQSAEATIRKEMERIMKEKEEEMRREREEMETRYKQEMEELNQKMKKEKEKTEKERKRREQELREKEERIKKEEKLRQKEQEKREEEERKWRKQEERQRQEWERRQKDLEEKIRSESKSKEATDQELKESRRKMEEEKEKRDKEREESLQKQKQEDEKREQKLKNLQDEYDRQRTDWRLEEDRIRKQQEKEKKELENNHKKEIEDSKTKAEYEARAKAEEEFQKKEKDKMEEHRKKINDLVRCICNNKGNVKKIQEKLDEHEKEIKNLKDTSQKETRLKEQDEELSRLLQAMINEGGPSTARRILEWVLSPLPHLLFKMFGY